jgi:hypothetical protein
MDVPLLELWFPILLSAVLVFIASAIAHTVMPHHKKDFVQVPDESGFLAAVRGKVSPGQYWFPHCEPSQMKDPDVKRRIEAGPHGVRIVWPGLPKMGGTLFATFIFYVVVGVFVAYLGSVTLPRGAEYLKVFQVTGTAAMMAHCLGIVPFTIWFSKSVKSTAMDIIDGIVYGLLTAGVFGWLWPEASITPPL